MQRSRIGLTVDAIVVVASLLGAADPVQGFTPLTRSEDRLSVATEGHQTGPAMAGYPDGSYIVAWGAVAVDPLNPYYESPDRFYARRFDSTGAPLGLEFVIATLDSSFEQLALAARPDGGFVAVWNVGGEAELRGRVFGANDAPLSAEFDVNTLTTGRQDSPSVAVRSDGRFLVAWGSEDHVDDASETGVRARVFDAAGNALAPEFLVNTYTPEYQTYPKVAATTGGNFAIVWGDRTQDGSFFSVYGRVFDGNGTALTTEVPIHQMMVGLQLPGGIAPTSTGGFVVTWESEYEDANFDTNIIARVFDSLAQPLGPEFQVNTSPEGSQQAPHIAVRSDDSFLIVWSRWEGGFEGGGIFGQLFDASAQPLGSEFQLSSLYQNLKVGAQAFLPPAGGRFFAAWAVSGPMSVDGDGTGVYGTIGCIGDGADADGDGVGDDCDICDVPTGETIVADTRLGIRFFNDLNPQDRFSWSADFPLPLSSWSELDPTTQPVRIRVEGDLRRPLIDLELPTSMFAGNGSAGWVQNGSGTTWKYRNKTAEPDDGIVSVSLLARGETGIRLKIVGKGHPYGISPDESVVKATIEVGDARAGECAETGFLPADCASDARGRGYSCTR